MSAALQQTNAIICRFPPFFAFFCDIERSQGDDKLLSIVDHILRNFRSPPLFVCGNALQKSENAKRNRSPTCWLDLMFPSLLYVMRKNEKSTQPHTILSSTFASFVEQTDVWKRMQTCRLKPESSRARELDRQSSPAISHALRLTNISNKTWCERVCGPDVVSLKLKFEPIRFLCVRVIHTPFPSEAQKHTKKRV